MTWALLVDLAQVVGAAAAVIAIPLAIYLYWRSRPRPRMSCAFGPLERFDPPRLPRGIPGDQTGASGITLLFDGKPVERVFLLRARIENTGNVPLRHDQVHMPVTIAFPPSVQLLQAQVMETRPASLGISLDAKGTNAAVTCFELWNPGESAWLRFLCSGPAGPPVTSAHIEGISGVEMRDWDSFLPPYAALWRWPGFSFLVCMVFAVLINFAIATLRLHPTSSPARWVAVAVLFGLFLVIALSTLKDAVALARALRRRRSSQR